MDSAYSKYLELKEQEDKELATKEAIQDKMDSLIREIERYNFKITRNLEKINELNKRLANAN